MIALGRGHEIRLVHAKTGNTIRTLQVKHFSNRYPGLDCLQFNRRGSLLLATSSVGRRVDVWEVYGGRLVATLLPGEEGPLRAVFHPTRNAIAVATNLKVVLYEIGGLEYQSVFAQQTTTVRSSIFSKDGKKLFCLSGPSDKEGQLSILNPDTDQRLASFPARFDEIEQRRGHLQAVHPRNNMIAYSPDADCIVFRSLEDEKETQRVTAKMVTHLCSSPDGQRLWGLLEGKTLQSWDWISGIVTSRWPQQPLPENIFSISLATSHNWVLLGGQDGSSRLFKTKDGQLFRTWPALSGPISAVAIHPREQVAVSGCHDGTVRVTHIPNGKVVTDLKDHLDRVTSVTYNRAGTLLATGSHDQTVQLYKVKGEKITHLMTLKSQSGPVEHLSFHPDGRRLAMVVRGETAVRIWHLDRLRTQLATMNLDDPDWADFDNMVKSGHSKKK